MKYRTPTDVQIPMTALKLHSAQQITRFTDSPLQWSTILSAWGRELTGTRLPEAAKDWPSMAASIPGGRLCKCTAHKSITFRLDVPPLSWETPEGIEVSVKNCCRWESVECWKAVPQDLWKVQIVSITWKLLMSTVLRHSRVCFPPSSSRWNAKRDHWAGNWERLPHYYSTLWVRGSVKCCKCKSWS